MISLGNKEISFIALGDAEISSIYKGNTEVYESTFYLYNEGVMSHGGISQSGLSNLGYTQQIATDKGTYYQVDGVNYNRNRMFVWASVNAIDLSKYSKAHIVLDDGSGDVIYTRDISNFNTKGYIAFSDVQSDTQYISIWACTNRANVQNTIINGIYWTNYIKLIARNKTVKFKKMWLE